MATQLLSAQSLGLIAGIVGPIWFTTLVIIQGILQPDYSHIAMPISALAVWFPCIIVVAIRGLRLARERQLQSNAVRS